MRHSGSGRAGHGDGHLEAEWGKASPKPRKLLDVLDFTSLRRLLEKSQSDDAYVRSALYYAFTGRGKVKRLGKGKDTLILISHPNLKRSILIFFPFAQNIHSFSRQVCLLRNAGTFLTRFDHVLLARIPETLVEAAFGERTEIPVGPFRLRKTQEAILDWAYPSYDVCLEKLVHPAGWELATYRKKIRKFDDNGVALVSMYDEEQDEVRKAIVDVSWRWVLTKSKRLAAHPERRSLLHEMLAPYRSLASLSSVKELAIDGFILKRGSENLAFSFWEKPRTPSEPVVCMAALPSSHERGLSEYLYYRIGQKLFAQDYKTMCIGGSETAELSRFKRKLAPIKAHHLYTLELDFRGGAR